uniref:Uncharacterized protein n=1 Tax=uncultured Thiotrichaceae bacterium TaxID=298394 RepID=A0A6S6ULH9_9GAMM|nr:MAG: Unknown protein [uncultured Thiotrichaceae bacterium]
MRKVIGRLDGYSWYFQSNANRWSLEIAEDQHIEPEDLPLVGYGCSGWLYESEEAAQLDDKQVDAYIQKVFALLKQDKLSYIPTVNNSCSD